MSSKIEELLNREKERQISTLCLIPSENYVSDAVLEALGSVATNKYSEGFPGRRYYGGNQIIDEIENYACQLAKKLFGVEYANVQAYSGSPANLAIHLALARPGDATMGLKLTDGGHLTHGAKVSETGKLFHSFQYGVGKNGRIDFDEVEKLAQKVKPKIIWAGTTAYPYILEFEKFGKIAEKVGAYLVADISHISGLVACGEHPSPVEYADVVMTTTHKTLRGPRGAIIMVTKKGLKKDPELAAKIEKEIFPGLQGGPHNNTTAAIAVALEEILTPQFRNYSKQVVKNAAMLARELDTESENHLMLLDLSYIGFGLGAQAQIALEQSGIIVNKNLVPESPRTLTSADAEDKNNTDNSVSAFYPNGIRLGTPALTTRGMKEQDMVKIAGWIKQVLGQIEGFDLPIEQKDRRGFMEKFRKDMQANKVLKEIRKEVGEFAQKFLLTS